MEKEGRNRSLRMSLMELSIMIAMFAVVSVLLTQMYVKADHLQGTSTQISKSIVLCETIAETIKGSDSFEAAMQQLGLQSLNNNTSYLKQYDGNWASAEERVVFQISVTPIWESVSNGKKLTATVTAQKEESQELCSLTVKRFYPN